MTLSVRDLVLPLAEFTLDVSMTLSRGTTALYGPSGAGKTTLLELIAGIRRPQSGRIEMDGRVVCDAGVWIAPRHRLVGYVPQDDALFPHLSVRQNVFYGAPAGVDSGGDSGDVIEVLEIGSLLDRNVQRLSGGERKRVALARALLTRPDVLLLDEPLAGVDLPLRDRVLGYLVRVRDEFPIPTVYVTHHMQEVEAICEEMVVLERGRVISHHTVQRPTSPRM
jgi:molybdate transport system ATP-binding protein